MICPLCELANSDDVNVCAECGKELMTELVPDEEVELMEGHESTQVGGDMDTAFALAAIDSEGVAPLDDLEQTQIFDAKLDVPIEALELDELLPAAPGAPSVWTAELPELDLGRSEDRDAKTPAPDEKGPCPWCGFPGDGAVCNNCGRRRNRYSREASAGTLGGTAQPQTLLCPACFTRVLIADKCGECMAPLPRTELL